MTSYTDSNNGNITANNKTYDLLEPFLFKEMTDEEFNEYMLIGNHEIPIEKVDFNKTKFIV